MAEKDADEPSLELPSFGFRKRRTKKSGEEPADVQPTPEPVPAPEPTPEPVPSPVPTPEPVPVEPSRDPDPIPTEPPVEPEPAPTTVAPRPLFTDDQPAATTTAVEAPPEEAEKPRREFALPTLGGIPASLVTGVLTGLLLVGLVWLSLRGCELLSGTSSCGNPGFFLLVAALVVTAAIGSRVLAAFAVPEPGSTSALATGLVAVVALLFLGGELFAWWMVVALPVASAVTHVLSHWVTTTLVDTLGDDTHR